MDAPLFAEFPLTLECEVAEITDGPGGLRVIGRVVNMSADESILGEDGLVDADKANFLAYDPGPAASTASWAAWSARPYHDGQAKM